MPDGRFGSGGRPWLYGRTSTRKGEIWGSEEGGKHDELAEEPHGERWARLLEWNAYDVPLYSKPEAFDSVLPSPHSMAQSPRKFCQALVATRR